MVHRAQAIASKPASVQITGMTSNHAEATGIYSNHPKATKNYQQPS